MMLKTFKNISAVIISVSLIANVSFADAIDKWANGEFSLSSLSKGD